MVATGNWTLWMISRWFNLRLDLLVTGLTFVTSIIAVATRSGSGALGSLAVSYTIRLARCVCVRERGDILCLCKSDANEKCLPMERAQRHRRGEPHDSNRATGRVG